VSSPELARTGEAVEAFLHAIGDAPFVALDTETTGLDPAVDRVLLVQLGTADRQLVVDAQAVGGRLLELLAGAGRLWVMHHAKFDLKMLGTLGDRRLLTRLQVQDTMLAEQLLTNGRKGPIAAQGFGLKALAERYAGMGLDKSVREGFQAAADVSALGEVELRYAARDVEATYKVFAAQLPLLDATGLLRVAAIEGAACVAFAEIERVGMPIDAEQWRRLVDDADREKADKRRELDQHFKSVISFDLFGGGALNYDADAEVLPALAKLGVELPSIRRELLEATGHPAALALAAYREHQKIVSTYGRRFLEHVHARTGRVHTSMKPIGAITGRVASSEPNLQNIPARSSFRGCFRAPPGRVIVTADYSAAELRILAEMSRDPVFLRTFAERGDLHAIVAAQVFGRPVSKTENPELRARAKAINFGLAYGMGAQGLAAQIGASVDEAERLLERYFRAFPAIRGHLERSARDALERGFAETLAGRRFWFQDQLTDGVDEGTRLRVAKNMPIQGTNADMTKLAMGRIARAVAQDGLDAAIVNMVHDELVLECEASVKDRVVAVVEREMIAAGAELLPNVPIEVETHVGEAWLK
jgi:DNA polymerase I-like protein with 3'-5' exonuclease and polymerase domains